MRRTRNDSQSRPRRTLALAAAGALLSASLHADAQAIAGPNATPVDRNVADTSANSASQRLAQPGLGQFGVGSILLDRQNNPHTQRQAVTPFEQPRHNPFVEDPRTSHRYLMQAPGVTALMNQTDYIGPSPRGGWVRNQQTFDGYEILTFSADTVFVLSPELLQPPARLDDPVLDDHPSRVQPKPLGDPLSTMRRARRTGYEPLLQPRPANSVHPAQQMLEIDPHYVHPEIIERRRRLKAEREAEAQQSNVQQSEPQQSEAASTGE